MIETNKLKELIQLMVDNDLTELDLQDEKQTVTLKRGYQGGPIVHAAPAPVLAAAPIAAAAPVAGVPAAPSHDPGLIAIESPMVGTFYASANPDAPPFVAPGAAISPGAVLCLIEAMKVFNEIKADKTGTIAQVLVKNGEPVEFGQKLFLVKPS